MTPRACIVAIVVISFLAGFNGRVKDMEVRQAALPDADPGGRPAPHMVNFQGYLTDSAGTVIADTALIMSFVIFDAPELGNELWSEERSVEVQDGGFNVHLGQFNPIPDSVFVSGADRWLQVVIHPGQLLWPRTQITSVGYAIMAKFADYSGTAEYADVAGYALDVPCPLELTCAPPLAILALAGDGYCIGMLVDDVFRGIHLDTLVGDGIVIEKTGGQGVWVGNPGYNGYVAYDPPDHGFVSYSPGQDGFLACTTGIDGFSVLNATWDGLYVVEAGDDGVDIDSAAVYGVKVHRARDGVYVDSTTGDGAIDRGNGFHVRKANNFGFIADTTVLDNAFYVRRAGFHGLSVASAASAGLYAAADNYGVYVAGAGFDGVAVANCAYNGLAVVNAGINGVQVYNADTNGLDVFNTGTHGLHIHKSGDNAIQVDSAGWYGAYVNSKDWDGGLFSTSDPIGWGLRAYSYQQDTGNIALWCEGKIVATGSKSSVVNTSEGEVLFYAIETPDVEFMTSGTARLRNGEVTIDFEDRFTESISPDIPLKITATSKGTGSGLYVASSSVEEFTVRSWAGDPEAEFDWIAIGRRRGYEVRSDEIYPEGRKEREALYEELHRNDVENYVRSMEAKVADLEANPVYPSAPSTGRMSPTQLESGKGEKPTIHAMPLEGISLEKRE
jgi:hypothetical protein